MILEGIVTTWNNDRSVNVSPMGPIVELDASGDFDRLTLRPFRTSTTYQNLRRTNLGVFHITDDVWLLAQAAVKRFSGLPEFAETNGAYRGLVLADACRWYGMKVDENDDREPRATMRAAVVERGRFRDFLGFNRGKHAVVEAAILATRVGILPAAEIAAQFVQLKTWVEKTGGEQERRAIALLDEFIRDSLAKAEASRA